MENNIVNQIKDQLRDKLVVLFWSGGYESTLLLHLVVKHKIYNLCNLHVITVQCPHDIYRQKLNKEWLDVLQNKIVWHNIMPTKTIPKDIEYRKACNVCKNIRRECITQQLEVIKQNNPNREILLVTGHNLDDVASYYFENALYCLDKETYAKKHNRILETTNKLYPIFRYDQTYTFFRPLSFYTKNQLLHVFSEKDHDDNTLCFKQCFWINQRKRLLQRYLNDSNVPLDFEQVKQAFLRNTQLPNMEEYSTLPLETYLM